MHALQGENKTRNNSLVLLPPSIRQQPLACRDKMDAATQQLSVTMQRSMWLNESPAPAIPPAGAETPPLFDRRASRGGGFSSGHAYRPPHA